MKIGHPGEDNALPLSRAASGVYRGYREQCGCISSRNMRGLESLARVRCVRDKGAHPPAARVLRRSRKARQEEKYSDDPRGREGCYPKRQAPFSLIRRLSVARQRRRLTPTCPSTTRCPVFQQKCRLTGKGKAWTGRGRWTCAVKREIAHNTARHCSKEGINDRLGITRAEIMHLGTCQDLTPGSCHPCTWSRRPDLPGSGCICSSHR